MDEIKINDLTEWIKILRDDIKAIEYHLEYGATLQEHCNIREALSNDVEAFLKLLDDYADQEAIKDLDRLGREIL